MECYNLPEVDILLKPAVMESQSLLGVYQIKVMSTHWKHKCFRIPKLQNKVILNLLSATYSLQFRYLNTWPTNSYLLPHLSL